MHYAVYGDHTGAFSPLPRDKGVIVDEAVADIQRKLSGTLL